MDTLRAVGWGAFAEAAPELAASGRSLLSQYGVGLGFLATVRSDGGPRLHPVCPFIVDDALLVFIVDSPKHHDLVRDGRYALHALLPEQVDDEFYITGRAVRVDDAGRRAAAVAAYHVPVPDDHHLFELRIERALVARYRFRGDWPPAYTRWQAPASDR